MSIASSERAPQTNDPPQPDPPVRRTVTAAFAVVAEVLLVVVVTAIAVVLVFHLWNQPLRRPFNYQRDSLSMLSVVKSILEHGWFEHNPSLGFPFGQHWGDYPLEGDSLHFVLIKAFGLFSKNPVLVTNAYFLGGFVAVSVTSFLALRYLKLSLWPSLTAAVLFSFLPYHFLRGTGHLLLGAYWSVPLSCVLILLVLETQPLVPRGERGLRCFGRAVPLFAATLVIACTGTYYSAFFMVLATLAGGLRSLATRRWRPLLAGMTLSGFVVAWFALASIPALLYQHQHGKNPEVARRTVQESDYYALRPIQMVMPVPGHRIRPLSNVTARSLKAPNNSEGTSYLGSVTSIAFIVLLGICCLAIAGRPPRSQFIADVSLPVVPALVLAVTGGFSWIIGLSGFTEIRAWNRISVFLAFFSLAAAASAADQILAVVTSRTSTRILAPALAVIIVTVGVLDQTSSAIVPDSRRSAAEFDSDARFVRRLESQLPTGAAVFQLPYLPFPEGELETHHPMVDLDPLRGYVHSHRLRWSYGGMRYRDGDWQVSAVRQPVSEMVASIAAVGFQAVWIDRFGYFDRGRTLEEHLRQLLGSDPVESDDHRFAFFTLEGFIRAQAAALGPQGVASLRAAALALPRLRNLSGVTEEHPGTGEPELLAANEATIEVTNRTIHNQSVTLQASLSSLVGEPLDVQLSLGGRSATATVGVLPSQITQRFTLHPGKQTLLLQATSAPGNVVRINRLEVTASP